MSVRSEVKLVDQAILAVKEAGSLVAYQFKDSYNKVVLQKGFSNYVTGVDYDIQQLLQEKLKKILPESMFITEETVRNIKYTLSKPIWIIDPIDGTTNLLHKYPHLSISVALYLNGEGYMGIIYNPIREELFYAVKGNNAFLNNKEITTSCNKTLDKCVVGFGLPYDKNKASVVFPIAAEMFKNCQDLRRAGSAALDLAYVACGRLDGYFELDLMPWDFAAGMIILKEAGGRITDWDDQEVTLKTRNLIATNKSENVHNVMLNIINWNRNINGSPEREMPLTESKVNQRIKKRA
jgi:myo-inositol-1(or 4)-monophosphatase